ncbi:hypothetical protein ACOMHN_044542 [Nucella lapillus]
MEKMNNSLECIKEKLNLVCTKEDIQSLRDELNRRLDVLETNVFDLQKDKDTLMQKTNELQKENVSLRSQLDGTKKEISELKAEQNDHEQHGRLWNVRVFGLKETEGETVGDCVQKVVEVITSKLGVAVQPEEVEMAHRSGKPMGPAGASTVRSRPRPILVRFHSRQKKSEVLKNRRKLKQTGISIGEDLTMANLRLLKQTEGHSAVMSAWSSNGKIVARLKNSKTVRVTIGRDINSQLRL